jgi:hypothetical protein
MSRLFNAVPTADAILVSTSADAILVFAFAITPVFFLFILGERTGSLLGFISLSLSDFYILIFSHPSYS